MAQDAQLPFPLKGRSDNVAFGSQPPDTTREAVNVRGMDPKTGRIRGAQRSGCSKYASAVVSSGNKVQALASISYDRPKIRYQELDGDGITVSWSGLSAGQNEGVDVATDRQANVYLLDGSGIVEKRNSDGELLRTIPLDMSNSAQKPRRIIIDDDDSFYVMASPDVAGGESSSVMRYRLADDEDHVYELHWSLSFDGPLQEIDVRYGAMAVLSRGTADSTGFPYVTLYHSLRVGTPVLRWARLVPSRAYGLHISRNGGILTSHAADPDRVPTEELPGFSPSLGADPATGKFTEATIHDVGLVKVPSTTTGNEIPDAAADIGLTSRHRLHAVLMANHLDAVDGEDISVWPDHRWVLGQNPNPKAAAYDGSASPGLPTNPADYGGPEVDGDGYGVGGPTDKNPARWLKSPVDPNGVYTTRPAPKLSLAGAWRLPSVEFDGSAPAGAGNDPGCALQTGRANWQGQFKSDTTGGGSMNADGTAGVNHEGALIPGNTVGASYGEGDRLGWGNGWAISHLWRIPWTDTIQVLWWQNGFRTGEEIFPNGQMALLANARFDLGGGTGTAEGRIVCHAGYITLVSAHMNFQGTSESHYGGSVSMGANGSGFDPMDCVSQKIPLNGAELALISIVYAGWDFDDQGGAGYDHNSSLRINGWPGPRFSLNGMACRDGFANTVIGSPRRYGESHNTDMFNYYNTTVPEADKVRAFTGGLCEWYTVRGRTTLTDLNDGNNESVSHPSVNNNGDAPNTQNYGSESYLFSGTIPLGTEPYPDTDDARASWTQNTDGSAGGASDIEIMEGVIAHKYAIPGLLPDGTQQGTEGLCSGHPFGNVARWPVGIGSTGAAGTAPVMDAIGSTRPILAKWGAVGGDLVWAVNGAGLSHAAVSDSDRGLLCVGAQDGDDTGNEGAIARKIIDYGSSYSLEHGDGAWSHTVAHNLVPSDDAFTQWSHSANMIKEDRDKAGPFGTGTAFRWYGSVAGGNEYLIYNFSTPLGNQLTDETYYTFSVYARNYDADSTVVRIWDTEAPSVETQATVYLNWAGDEGTDVSIGATTFAGDGTETAVLTEIGGGWWRISVTVRYEEDHGDQIRVEIQPESNDAKTDLGCYLWGPQVVTGQTAGEFPPLPLFTNTYIQLEVDADDDLYWPRGGLRSLDKLDGETGVRLWSYQNGTSQADKVRAVAFDPVIPLYDTDIKMPQNVYIATVGGESGTSTAFPNLIVDPEDFIDPDSAWWLAPGTTGLDNTDIAPNGTLTADSVTSPTGALYTDNVVQDVVIAPALNAPYTYSVYVKKETTDHVQIIMYLIDGSTTEEQVNFTVDLDDGSILGFTSAETEGSGYLEGDLTIASDGGYWRISFTLTDYAGTCDKYRVRHYPMPQGNAESDPQEPDRTIVLWGAQLTNSDTIEPYGGAPGVEPTISKLQIVGEDQVIGPESSARATRYLAIGGGNVTVLEKGLAPAAATGGTGAFDAVAPRISTALFRNRLYMTDGRTYKYYDAKDNEVVDFVSKDAGEIPKRGRLMVAWDNRLVIARTADSDHNWYMSKKGSPDKWDAYPNVWTVLDAVNGDSDRGPGQSPDIINSLIPWSDDLLLMGGDHTIQRMTGNPLAGGQIDLISDQTGISFGSPWAKDPEGVLYFFGSRGGVYAYAPGQQVARISLDSIDRDLQDVNLGLYEIGMAWSYREDGLYIFQMPHGTGGVTQKGWFYERKTGAWYDMEFAATTLQPTAITVFDGDDPGDRIVAFGCEDGFVRFFDESAKNDDGTRIDSRVTIGPLAAGPGMRSRFSRLQVALASDQDGVEYEWFSSDSPDVMGEPRVRGRLASGLGPIIHRPISGGFLWLRLRNAAVSERWAFESASATVAPAGRARVTR